MTSKEYWSKREAEQLKKNIKDELEYNKKIKETYDYMLDNIQKEINGFYARYATKEGISLSEAKKRVAQLDSDAYGRKAKRYVKDKDFSKEANEEMRLYNATMKINRLELLKANIGLELVGGFDELQKYFDTTLTDRTLSEFKRQAGILGKSVLNNEKAAHSIVNASYQNAKFSDRIWMYQDMLKAELSSQLKIGLIQGRNPRELARHISKVFGVSRNNAERLMQTELARVQTEAQKQSYERNGYDQYEFIAEPTACPICRALDGKIFDVKKMLPGENASPIHPRCRCSAAAHMDREEFDKWLDFIDKGGTTEEWNKRTIRPLGKIDMNLLEKEFGKMQTDEIIVTGERLEHIKDRHQEDYELFQKHGNEGVQNPDYIVRDEKHEGTVFMVKKLEDTNLNMIVRLALATDTEGYKNSVMTFYRIRERNLKKLIKKNKLLYKRE
ncbi:minor capsid protein [Muricomes intestini]|jgi:SPP1 gp7 family putative phage head morphogenesis protein|uniref:minor capsid protein n=3 Tax=Muricomes intestini TaxID=1796634 RepID=UPI002FD9A349